MKKIVSVTPIYNNEDFIRPHFNMLKKHVDEMIVLLGDKPFPEYEEAFGISRGHDKSEEILRTEFPEITIYPQVGYSFGGEMLQDGLEKAKQHGADVMLKIDADMYLTESDFMTLVDTIQNTDFDSLWLDYSNNTFVYKRDFDHGVPCKIFPVGNDPIAISSSDSFWGDHISWGTVGDKKVTFNPKGVTVHHLTGFHRTDDAEIARCESLPGFPGWKSAPEEILKMFQVNNK